MLILKILFVFFIIWILFSFIISWIWLYSKSLKRFFNKHENLSFLTLSGAFITIAIFLYSGFYNIFAIISPKYGGNVEDQSVFFTVIFLFLILCTISTFSSKEEELNRLWLNILNNEKKEILLKLAKLKNKKIKSYKDEDEFLPLESALTRLDNEINNLYIPSRENIKNDWVNSKFDNLMGTIFEPIAKIQGAILFVIVNLFCVILGFIITLISKAFTLISKAFTKN